MNSIYSCVCSFLGTCNGSGGHGACLVHLLRVLNVEASRIVSLQTRRKRRQCLFNGSTKRGAMCVAFIPQKYPRKIPFRSGFVLSLRIPLLCTKMCTCLPSVRGFHSEKSSLCTNQVLCAERREKLLVSSEQLTPAKHRGPGARNSDDSFLH